MGWRTIMSGEDELGRTTVFAAPLGRDFEGWALIYGGFLVPTPGRR